MGEKEPNFLQQMIAWGKPLKPSHSIAPAHTHTHTHRHTLQPFPYDGKWRKASDKHRPDGQLFTYIVQNLAEEKQTKPHLKTNPNQTYTNRVSTQGL